MLVWCVCTCSAHVCTGTTYAYLVCVHMLGPRVHWKYVCLFGVCVHTCSAHVYTGSTYACLVCVCAYMLGPRVLLLISVAIVTDSTQTECIVLWINSVGLYDSAPPRTICIFLIEYNNLIKVCIKNYY